MKNRQSRKLSEISSRITSGGTPSRKRKEYFGGNVPWLTTKEIDFNRIKDTEEYISRLGLNNSSAKLIDENSVIVAMYGATAGKLCINKIPLTTNQACCNITLDPIQADFRFIFYYLLNSYPELSGRATGAAQQNLSVGVISDFEVNLPSLPEQRAIAEVLSSLDDKIDLLHRQNRTLEAMAEALFRQWFVVEAGADWEWKKLEEFVTVQRGLSYKGAGLAEEGFGVPMHNLNSVNEGGGYKYEGIKFYSGDFKERHKIKSGDVVVTNTEQGHEFLLIGYPAIIPQFYGETGIFSQHLYKLELKPETSLTKPFLYHLLMAFDIREQLIGSTNGSTVNMLPRDGIEWAKFQVPPKRLIDKFTAIVKPFLDKKEKNYTQTQQLEKLRDTLLPKLMSGETIVKTN